MTITNTGSIYFKLLGSKIKLFIVQVAVNEKELMEKENLNQGSGKVVTNDINGNIYNKEMERYEAQKKKQQIREAKQLKRQETYERLKEDPNSGNSGCCAPGDPCGGSGGGSCFCDAECCDLVILILCCPIMIFDQGDPLIEAKYVEIQLENI